MTDWHSLFVPESDQLTPELLQNCARDAGVHLYTDMCCPVWAARDLLMIHTTESGKRTIRLSHPAKVRILLGNPVPEQTVTEFEYEFSGPETILAELLEEQE